MIDQELPTALRDVAEEYLARDRADVDPDDNNRHLIAAFGRFSQRNDAHRRATWLCLLAAKRALSWPGHSFDPHQSEDHQAVYMVQQWVTDGIAPPNWDSICNRPSIVPQVGQVMRGSDTIANMVCCLARFALHCGIPDAVDALDYAWLLDSEEGRKPRYLMLFHNWLVFVALLAAYNLQELSNAELHPRIAE